jgi:hypothetical protein
MYKTQLKEVFPLIDKLRTYFPSLQHYETIPVKLNQELAWFITADSQLIGIHPDEMQEKDLVLFRTFLKPYQSKFPTMTTEEEKWQQWTQVEDVLPDIDFTFRFVYFQVPLNQIDPKGFKDAINQLFDHEVTILWQNENEGVIVDKLNKNLDDSISYKEIIDILMSDLYIKIQFFVGPYLSTLEGLRDHYQQLLAAAKLTFQHSQHNVVTYLEAIPYILMGNTGTTFKKNLRQFILQEFIDDGEFIHMMEVFFDSNLNISEAAKKLYMHRNSLQYRIEKFHERTGIDVRVFQQALTVYLAVLAKED